jgi:hemoglobin-like flavoprotein
MNKIKLIEKSFDKIVKNKDEFINSFYDDLFKLAPEVEYLFENTSKERQGEKLYNALVILVENINDPEALKDILQPLGQDHLNYGAQLAHYPVVGECLIKSLKKFNNEEWSEDIESAWLETYNSVVGLMNS